MTEKYQGMLTSFDTHNMDNNCVFNAASINRMLQRRPKSLPTNDSEIPCRRGEMASQLASSLTGSQSDWLADNSCQSAVPRSPSPQYQGGLINSISACRHGHFYSAFNPAEPGG